jgi:hypothetical protein
MSPQQAAYYEKLRKELLIQAAGVEVSAVNAAVQMGKLLQIASGAVYADFGTDDSRPILEFDCKEKLNELLDIIEQASHKVLVFGLYQLDRTLGSIFDRARNNQRRHSWWRVGEEKSCYNQSVSGYPGPTGIDYPAQSGIAWAYPDSGKCRGVVFAHYVNGNLSASQCSGPP